MTNLLRLLAEDQAGLNVLSAAMQDAIVKVGSLHFDKDAQTFFLYGSRYTHEGDAPKRRKTGLKVFNVLKTQYKGIDRSDPSAFMVLLSINVSKTGKSEPDVLDFVFAGGGGIRLSVDALEVRLIDTDEGRDTKRNPIHADV